MRTAPRRVYLGGFERRYGRERSQDARTITPLHFLLSHDPVIGREIKKPTEKKNSNNEVSALLYDKAGPRACGRDCACSVELVWDVYIAWLGWHQLSFDGAAGGPTTRSAPRISPHRISGGRECRTFSFAGCSPPSSASGSSLSSSSRPCSSCRSSSTSTLRYVLVPYTSSIVGSEEKATVCGAREH